MAAEGSSLYRWGHLPLRWLWAWTRPLNNWPCKWFCLAVTINSLCCMANTLWGSGREVNNVFMRSSNKIMCSIKVHIYIHKLWFTPTCTQTYITTSHQLWRILSIVVHNFLYPTFYRKAQLAVMYPLKLGICIHSSCEAVCVHVSRCLPLATLLIHSFIPAISIAPLPVLYYSKALPTTARILYRSFTPKRTGNCR